MPRQLHLADRHLRWSPLNHMPGIPTHGGLLLDWSEHPKKVCIYGAGLGKHEAPLDSEDWTVWALNLVPPMDSRGRVRADAWFDLHQRCAQTDDDLRWIAKCPVPIYVPDDLADHGDNTMRFPHEMVEQAFGASYFTCTFAYQIALAMLCGFEEIGLFGVELRYGSRREMTVEWACTSWWMGMAHANGIKLTVPRGSWLGGHPARYGLEYDRELQVVNEYVREVDTMELDGNGG